MQLTQLIQQAAPEGQRSRFVRELAQSLQVNASTIRHWCNGTRRPSPQHALRLEVLTQQQITRYELRPDIYGPKPINHPEEKNHD